MTMMTMSLQKACHISVVSLGVGLVNSAEACSVCFGAPDDTQSVAMKAAVLTMLGVTGTVMTAVAAVGWSIVRQGTRQAHDAEVSDVDEVNPLENKVLD